MPYFIIYKIILNYSSLPIYISIFYVLGLLSFEFKLKLFWHYNNIWNYHDDFHLLILIADVLMINYKSN